ncbi:MAG: helix-turn-helix protein [Herbinix sp.]|jgi:transcriptional regulator with XRE-family HTH domain|nr:helix-turn-helix protein [Herbinix sp.]
MVDHYKVGNYITLLRKEKGLTGEKLAELLQVSPQAVSKWENGKCLPETSLLPSIASVLCTSIDALLMPRELVILSANYTDGVKTIDVTQNVNNHVKGNVLNITVNAQFLGVTMDTPRVTLVIVKFQSPEGVFYDYALENEVLYVDQYKMTHCAGDTLQLIGAYYGNKQNARSVMQKMQHYEYFRWNEIHVNHETFPSCAAMDEPEFLTLIYTNLKGIHAISCEENKTLAFSVDRTSIYQKDTSYCILPDIMTLEWEKGMDCTWAGAVYGALHYMGEPYSYEQIMGISGACYRIAFTPVWDWSSVDALVAFDYSSILFRAIGYEQIWANRVEKEERSNERNKIMRDIQNGKPVIAINLRIAPEWGIITGYLENGKSLLCRTYFDKEYLNDKKDYLESDFWPFLITHFGEIVERPTEEEIVKDSLNALLASFVAPCERGYYQGKEAYEKWIEGLKDEKLWDTSNRKEDIDRRLGVNDSMLLNLIDARRCAYQYLNEVMEKFEGDRKEKLFEVVMSYKQMYEMLEAFRTKLLTMNQDNIKYNEIVTKREYSASFRSEQVTLLNRAIELEDEIVTIVRDIM